MGSLNGLFIVISQLSSKQRFGKPGLWPPWYKLLLFLCSLTSAEGKDHQLWHVTSTASGPVSLARTLRQLSSAGRLRNVDLLGTLGEEKTCLLMSKLVSVALGAPHSLIFEKLGRLAETISVFFLWDLLQRDQWEGCQGASLIGASMTTSLMILYHIPPISSVLLLSLFYLLLKIFFYKVFHSRMSQSHNPDCNIFLSFLFPTPKPILIFNDFTSHVAKQDQEMNYEF